MRTAIVVADSGSTVHLRQEPDVTSKIEYKVPIGASVSILSEAGDWANVKYADNNGKTYTGWMMTRYLNRQSASEPPAAIDAEAVVALYEQAGKLQAAIGELIGIHG